MFSTLKILFFNVNFSVVSEIFTHWYRNKYNYSNNYRSKIAYYNFILIAYFSFVSQSHVESQILGSRRGLSKYSPA